MSRKKLRVTTHARIRARERLEVSSHAEVNKTLNNALTYGHPIADFDGDFARFLESKKKKCKSGVGIKVYMETVVFYRNKTIITTYKVPDKYQPSDEYLKVNYANDPWLGKLYELVGKENVEYQVFPPSNSGDPYVTGLVVFDRFEGYGMGKSQWKSINHACRAYVKRYLKESEGRDEDVGCNEDTEEV